METRSIMEALPPGRGMRRTTPLRTARRNVDWAFFRHRVTMRIQSTARTKPSIGCSSTRRLGRALALALTSSLLLGALGAHFLPLRAAPPLPTSTPTPTTPAPAPEAFPAPLPAPATNLHVITFACIGDFGSDKGGTRTVARYIKSWNPQFIITVGDNNYPSGSAATIDKHIGQFFHEYIHPYQGRFGLGARTNRFFPTLGNHDWLTADAAPYLNYFSLPGNERYYSFVRGAVHFFAVDSDKKEPDGTSSDSPQGRWLQQELAGSTSVWKVVYFHHAPYSSGIVHGSYTNETTYMRWPFKEWGASVVLAGHDHIYERIEVDGLTYIVNGLGGDSRDNFHFPLVEGSVKQFNREVGVLRGDASVRALTLRFFTWRGELVDTFILRKDATGATTNISLSLPDRRR
jgi:tartrate-resistant acid phosphatase type 5